MMKKTNEYVYKNPLDNGYIKFKLTKKQHNKLFKHRQLKWLDKYEYYYNEKNIILHRYYNLLFKIPIIIFFPLIVLFGGIVNFKEMFIDFKKSLYQKKYGDFSSDSISSKSDLYKEIIDVIKNNLK